MRVANMDMPGELPYRGDGARDLGRDGVAHKLLDHEAVAEAFGLGDVARGVDECGEASIADFVRPDLERRDL